MSEEINPPMLITSPPSNSVGVYTFAPCKVHDTYPMHYRLARTHTGRTILQGAYYWRCGSDSGFEWRKMPTVQLGADGTVAE